MRRSPRHLPTFCRQALAGLASCVSRRCRAEVELGRGRELAPVDLLRCEPRPYDADATIIGPDGGTLHIGEHQLVIPRGALTREELIVAEAPTSSPGMWIFAGRSDVRASRRAQLEL